MELGEKQALRVVNAEAGAAGEGERARHEDGERRESSDGGTEFPPHRFGRTKVRPYVPPHFHDYFLVKTNTDACHGVASTYKPRF